MIGANDGRNHTQIKPADFHISVKPVSIELECPFCHEEIAIKWKDIIPPEYWCDKWDDVNCPYCDQPIELGDYDYD